MQSISEDPSPQQLALQERMRKQQGLVADRLFHLKTYSKCMVGSEMVDWLVADTSTGPYLERRTVAREECVQQFQSLIDAKLLHHVKDEHQFEDTMLFYRFYADEVGEPSSSEKGCKEEVQRTAEALLEKQIREQPGLISNRKFHLVTYENVMVGSEFVDWMMASSKTPLTRAQCVVKGQALINARMLHHVTDEHRFEDDMLFYKFYSDEPSDFVPTTSFACLDNPDLTPAHMAQKKAATKPAKQTAATPEIPAYDPNNMHLYT